MSLINDALKRAKQMQHHSPAAAQGGPPSEPAEHHVAGSGSPGHAHLKPIPWITLTGIALLAVILVWEGIRPSGPSSASWRGSTVKARANAPAFNLTIVPPAGGPEPSAEPAPSGARESPARAEVTEAPAVESDPVPWLSSAATESPAASAPSGPAAGFEGSPPSVSVLKLQAIVFHPSRPCVMINGKTLFMGDRIGDLQLVAVDRQSVTLAAGGRTNFLRLP